MTDIMVQLVGTWWGGKEEREREHHDRSTKIKKTCKTLGKFSLCASWVAMVDFPTQAVPHTRITNGTL